MSSATREQVKPSPHAVGSRRAQRYQEHRRRIRHQIIGVTSAVILVATLTVVYVASSGGGDTTETTTPFVGTTVDVILGDYLIAGDSPRRAGEVRLEAVNQGGIVRDTSVSAAGRSVATCNRVGASRSTSVHLLPGTYQLYCDIVGHVEQGMVADLVIT